MKKFILSVLSVLMIASVAYAQPKLEIVGGNSYDWGKVGPKDSPLKTKVKIKNTGNEQLIITNVKPSCGCTTAPLDKDKLNPGEVATIDVSFNVGSRAGVNSKTIRISSNDPANSTTIFRLSADVQKEVTVSPAFLDKVFKAIEADANAEVEVDLPNQKVTIMATGESEGFEINGYKKNNMLNGFDDIDYLQNMKSEIGTFEEARPF